MQQKTPPGTNYWDYIRVEDLLTLQGGMGRDESQLGNDEVMFIVVHQVYELWFKELLHEFDRVRHWLEDDEPHRALHGSGV